MRSVYFAHPINTYGTPLELELLDLLEKKWKGDLIVNPGAKEHVEEVVARKMRDPNANVMDYFLGLVRECNEVVVLPFPDGKWGAGVYAEAQMHLDVESGKWIWVIDPTTREIRFVPKLDPALRLSVEETRARVYLNSARDIRAYW